MNIPLAHVESGLRSFDRTMPEEFNRILTDDLADLFLLTEESGRTNLLKEGKPEAALHMVGNTMIDTLVAFEQDIQASDVMGRLGLGAKPFVLMTIHRPANVDDPESLGKLHRLVSSLASRYDMVFPVHPRTRKNFEKHGMAEAFAAIPQLILTDPIDYLGIQKLIANAKFIITDSGGIQEETTFRQVPCLTLRPNTERPVTIDMGTNTLVTFDVDTLLGYTASIEAGTYKTGRIPPLWDGRASERILEAVDSFLK
jgi:UDP-N-acetylglucosamine 2-epimerase (non-hydrolysing)